VKNLALGLAAPLLVACSPAPAQLGPPLAPLSPPALSSPAPSGSQERVLPPPTSDDWQPRDEHVQSLALPNGMRVMLVARPGLQAVVAHWVVDAASPPAKKDAELFRAQASAAFRPPHEESGTSYAACFPGRCWLSDRGAPEELERLLRDGATWLREEPALQEISKRIEPVAAHYPTTLDASRGGRRNGRTLVFGYDHPYGASKAPTKTFSAEELIQWRRASFAPQRTVLVLVGDLALDQVKERVSTVFGAWAPGPRAAREPFARGAVPESHVLLTNAGWFPTDYGTVVAGGPPWGSDDVAPTLVATRLFQSALPRGGACQWASVRPSGSPTDPPVAFYPEGTLVALGNTYEPHGAIPALRPVLEAIRRAREAPPADEDVARAKRLMLADWRRRVAYPEALAGFVALSAFAGTPDAAVTLEAKLAAVTPADVQRVARTYFAESALGAVLIGAGDHFGDVQDLGLGGAKLVDTLGRSRAEKITAR
jgi:predicted Zn-dependent peptidase